MKTKYLITYDFYTLKDGTEQFGVVGIFLAFLNSNKFLYKINKHKFDESILNVIKKFISLYKEINKEEFEIVFCYNLINTINAWIIKNILFKNFKIVFISADFSKNRFSNFILSHIYVLLDYIASVVADEVWSCSKRVFDYRKSFLNENKNFYVPNIPNYVKNNFKKYDKFTIVMISFLNFNYMFDQVYSIFNFIKENNIRLIIVGEGNLKNEIEDKINKANASENVELTGYLKHSQIEEILEKSHIGLALYGGKLDYNFWGDSIKIREYTYYNLPVITTKNVYNEKEVREENLGICIEDFNGLLNSVKKLYEDNTFYNSIIESTKIYNKKYQIDKIFKERIDNVY